jgi:hypothetical protein
MQYSGIAVRDDSYHRSLVRPERLEKGLEVFELRIHCSFGVEVKSAEERIGVRVENIALVVREGSEEGAY